jgi:hypothetical protein
MNWRQIVPLLLYEAVGLGTWVFLTFFDGFNYTW